MLLDTMNEIKQLFNNSLNIVTQIKPAIEVVAVLSKILSTVKIQLLELSSIMSIDDFKVRYYLF
jgi:hypothetical protein